MVAVRIDARGSRQLRASILAMKAATEPALRKKLYAAARGAITPAWQEALRGYADTRLEVRVLAETATTKTSQQGFKVTSAAKQPRLSGRRRKAFPWWAVEYGAGWHRTTVETRSRTGTPYDYQRVQNKMHKPRRRDGYVAGPAAGSIGRRLVALWVQRIVLTYRSAAEGREV